MVLQEPLGGQWLYCEMGVWCREQLRRSSLPCTLAAAVHGRVFGDEKEEAEVLTRAPPGLSASAYSRFFHPPDSLFGRQFERGADEFLDPFLTGEPQTEQGALVLQIDVKIEERAALSFRRNPIRQFREGDR